MSIIQILALVLILGIGFGIIFAARFSYKNSPRNLEAKMGVAFMYVAVAILWGGIGYLMFFK